MKKSLNPYWLLGCMIFIFILLLASYQLFPKSDITSNDKLKNIYDLSINHLNVIAKNPHYYGNSEKENVKNYIVSVIEKYGYKATLQKGHILNNFKFSNSGNQTIFAIVENIYVEIPGSSDDKIIIVAHYDSVPFGPGAADNSTAVCASLAVFENVCMDILKGDKPLNSIIFLFTDAEEIGLLGAEYFVENYKEKDKIAAVLNLDARGNRGKSILFQSNDKNGNIIRQYSKYDKNLIGFSFANDIYKRMPNRTDFTPFLESDIDGLNFAFLQNSVVYHSFLDNIKNLSTNSINQTISKVQNFIDAFSDYHFDSTKLISKNKNPYIYFTLFGKLFIFSKTFYIILPSSIFLIIIILLIFSLIKKLFSFKNLLISFFQNLALFILFALTLFFSRFILYLIFPNLNIFYVTPYNEHLYFIFLYALSFLIVHLIVSKFSKFINFYSFYLTSSLFSFILMLIVINFIAGISLIFLFQSISFLLIFIISILFKSHYDKVEEKTYYIFSFIPSIITLSIGIPFSYLAYIALGLKNISFTFIGLFPIIPIFAGNYKRLSKYDKSLITTFLFILCIVFLFLIISNYNFDENRPILSSMTIEKDLDSSQLSIILPYNEVRYSNNPWHKSILSLGNPIIEKGRYKVSEIKDVKLQNLNFFEILNQKEDKRFKEYEINIKSDFWEFTLPENSQLIINNKLIINFDKITTFRGYLPYNTNMIVKIRIPISQILKYSFISYYFKENYKINIPQRPKELLGIYDYIVEKGSFK
ncbi:MAG: M28 family peptidase [Exilispira sp.]|jgi:hypothetical protein|nr:M28 family peptidase [Exilispira sp.]